MLTQAKIIQEVKSTQETIRNSLEKEYRKGESEYAFGFFENPERFYNAVFKNVKKPLVQCLKSFCNIEITSIVKLAYFMFVYQYCKQINSQCDPETWYDNFLRKPLGGGQLGRILKKNNEEVMKFYNDIRILKDDLNNKINLYNFIRYHIKGYHHAKSLTNNFELVSKNCLQTFHIGKISEYKSRLLDNINQYDEFEKKSLPILKHEILNLRVARMELDATCFILNRKSELFTKNDFLIYLIQREILRNFKDRLLLEEKKLFWQWFIRLSLINEKKSQYQSLYKQTQNLYEYSENYGFHSLLNNAALVRKIDEEMENFDILTTKELDEIHNDQIKRCNGLITLLEDATWRFFSTFDEANWQKKFTFFFKKELQKPIELLDKIINQKQMIENVHNAHLNTTIISLYTKAENIYEEIHVMENLRKSYPVTYQQECENSQSTLLVKTAG